MSDKSTKQDNGNCTHQVSKGEHYRNGDNYQRRGHQRRGYQRRGSATIAENDLAVSAEPATFRQEGLLPAVKRRDFMGLMSASVIVLRERFCSGEADGRSSEGARTPPVWIG